MIAMNETNAEYLRLWEVCNSGEAEQSLIEAQENKALGYYSKNIEKDDLKITIFK